MSLSNLDHREEMKLFDGRFCSLNDKEYTSRTIPCRPGVVPFGKWTDGNSIEQGIRTNNLKMLAETLDGAMGTCSRDAAAEISWLVSVVA